MKMKAAFLVGKEHFEKEGLKGRNVATGKFWLGLRHVRYVAQI